MLGNNTPEKRNKKHIMYVFINSLWLFRPSTSKHWQLLFWGVTECNYFGVEETIER